MTMAGKQGRLWALLGGMLLLSLTTGCASTNTTASAQDTIAACTDLVLDYAVFRDQGNVEGYVGLFAEDGTLTLPGNTITGHAAIRERATAAARGPRTRHLMSTIRITPIDANRATGVSYATIYSALPPEDGSVAGPFTVQGFTVIGDYVDEFVRTDAGWRISKRRLDVQFLHEGK